MMDIQYPARWPSTIGVIRLPSGQAAFTVFSGLALGEVSCLLHLPPDPLSKDRTFASVYRRLYGLITPSCRRPARAVMAVPADPDPPDQCA
jgi:hypothetical protein